MTWRFALTCDDPECRSAFIPAPSLGEFNIKETSHQARRLAGWHTKRAGNRWLNYCPKHASVSCDFNGCPAEGKSTDEWYSALSSVGPIFLCPTHAPFDKS